MVGVVACVSAKQDCAARADRLYVSPLFRKAAAFVQRHSDEWIILSAQHGVLHPADVVGPYDRTLKAMTARERAAWRGRVRAQLRQFGPDARFVTTAGKPYREALPRDRTACPWEDLDGMGIGRQLQWLTRENASPTWTPRWTA